jgi:hypothetical protein
VLSWIESSSIASAVRESALITATLSAIHLLGMTLVTGSAVMTLLGLGTAADTRTASDVNGTTGRAITVGLVVSLATGALLVAPRVSTAVENDIFRLKMLLLAVAVALHVTWRSGASPSKRLAAVRASIWAGVACAGAAYILLE